MDSSSGCAVSACDITAMPNHATSAPGASSSVRPIVDVNVSVDGSSGYIIYACDGEAAPYRATSTLGTLDALSSISSLVDAIAAGSTSPDGAMATQLHSYLPPVRRRSMLDVSAEERGFSSALSSGDPHLHQCCERHDG